jgi:hypothetical protein
MPFMPRRTAALSRSGDMAAGVGGAAVVTGWERAKGGGRLGENEKGKGNPRFDSSYIWILIRPTWQVELMGKRIFRYG